MSKFDKIIEKITQQIQSNQIDLAIQSIGAELNLTSDKALHNSLLALRAECHQLSGNIPFTLSDINKINKLYLSDKQAKELNLLEIKSKLQVGNFDEINSLINKFDKNSEIPRSILWRSSLALSVLGETKLSQRFHDEHLEQVQDGSFQQANNIIYTNVIPKIINNDSTKGKISAILRPIETAKEIYISSSLDFQGQLGNRAKSYCQTLLVEAYVQYRYNNLHYAYVSVITAGLLLKKCNCSEQAEGIGEIIHSLKYANTPLYRLLLVAIHDTNIIENDIVKKNTNILVAVAEAIDNVENFINQEIAITSSDRKANMISKCSGGKNMNKTDKFDSLIKCHCDNKYVIEKLIANIKKNCITPFFGAGISAWVYPLWSDLLHSISNQYGIESEVQEKMDMGEFENAASIIEKEAGKFDFCNKIKQIFDPELIDEAVMPSYLHNIPLIWSGNIITTNFDHVIEEIYDYRIKSIIPHNDEYEEPRINESLQQNMSILIKLHGDIDNVWNLILTKEQYDDYYGENDLNYDKEIPKLLSKILNSQSILFIGCSLLNDRTLSVVFQNTNEGLEHFALVELPKVTENIEEPYSPKYYDENKKLLEDYNNRRKYLSSHNINRIWYPHGKHQEAVKFLLEGLLESLN